MHGMCNAIVCCVLALAALVSLACSVAINASSSHANVAKEYFESEDIQPAQQLVALQSVGVGTSANLKPKKRGVEWLPDVSPKVETQVTSSGHHLVRALINGQDHGWFVFDSGAGGSALDQDVVDALDLTVIGPVKVVGVGGLVSSQLVRARSLTVGPLTLHGPTFVGVDLTFLEENFGVNLAGIIGHNVLAHSVARLIPHQAVIELYPPGDAPEASNWIDVDLSKRVPVISARVEGHEGQYRIDTGAARSSVNFHTPTVERLRLLKNRDVEVDTNEGLGGKSAALKGTIDSFELAGESWSDLPVKFSQATTGAFANAATDGNIGGRVLKRFELWFDYTNRRIGFIPLEQAD